MKNLVLITIIFFCSFLSAQTNEPQGDVSTTIGFLNGGGSLIGLDFEFRLHNQFSAQLGLGLVGFGAGINLHMYDDLHSNFFSFQYYHQGVGATHVQSIVVPTYNIRLFNFLAASIGIGGRVIEGELFNQLPFEYQNRNLMLLYSIGVYKV